LHVAVLAGQTRLTTAAALEWAMSSAAAGPVTRRQRLSVIRCFARHLAALDPACEVPPAGLLKAPARRRVPYLYSPQEIPALIAAAGTLHAPLPVATYQALISLLAATGLRISEALTLARGDVDLDAGVLRVTGKYGKVRLIPLHPAMTSMLARYAARRETISGFLQHLETSRQQPPATPVSPRSTRCSAAPRRVRLSMPR
jgi:integrase/recombinase XerD